MLLLYHVCFVLFVWSYGRTIFSPLGSVPKRFRLSSEDMETIDSADDHKSVLERIVVSKDLPCTMRSIQQEIRYCSECSLVKPDRTHHCSVCGACVLKVRSTTVRTTCIYTVLILSFLDGPPLSLGK